MQQSSEYWEISSCHSNCSTNERHCCNVDVDEPLDYEPRNTESLAQEKAPLPGEIVHQEDERGAWSSELEDGEIRDSLNAESRDGRSLCRFFQKGSCAFLEKCRFLHHSDTGLYRFFSPPHPMPPYVRSPVIPDIPLPVSCSEGKVEEEDDDDADWDRVLEEAKRRVGLKKKARSEQTSTTSLDAHHLASPIPRNKTPVRSVRYGDKEERRLRGPSPSDRNRNRTSCDSSSPVSYRNNRKRRRSRSRSRRPRISCKCCRTPSTDRRCQVSSRRPICCYRRKKVSSSSSSLSPVSTKRVAMRRSRDVSVDDRRKHRGMSLASSRGGTKIKPTETTIGVRGLESVPRKSRDKIQASSKPSVTKCSDDRSIGPTSHSPSKVVKLSSYDVPNPCLSDMSISPLPLDSLIRNPNSRFPSIRSPSDMSISPFSNSPSPIKFSVPAWAVTEVRVLVQANAAAFSRPPRNIEDSARNKIVISSVPERKEPQVILPRVSMSKTSASSSRLKSQVVQPKPSTIMQKVPKCVATKKRLKSDLAELKSPAVQREEPKAESSIHKKIFRSRVVKPNPHAIAREKAKYVHSNYKEKPNNGAGERSTKQKPHVLWEELKYERSAPKKRYQRDVVKPKPSDKPISDPNFRKEIKKEPKSPTTATNSESSDSKKRYQRDVVKPKPSFPVPQDKPISGSDLRKKIIKEPESSTIATNSGSSVSKKRLNSLMLDLLKFRKADLTDFRPNVNAGAPRSLPRRESSARKGEPKSAAQPCVVSRKELLLKQLADIEAAIQEKQKLSNEKIIL